MCGICGKVSFGRDNRVERETIEKMMFEMRHRGPDDEDVYLSGGVALGHKRLSIIDLDAGRQPLSNEDGTVWVAFNGEIYNYRPLREFLLKKGHRLKTKTDTEVIVHLYEEFGERFIEKLCGMFSFAIWDEKDRTLMLARDRVGIKPLYYSVGSDSLTFASEVKSLLADPTVGRDLDERLVDRFLTFYYVPGEDTLFKKVRKLSPGHYLILRNGKLKTCKYWDLDFPSESAKGSLDELTESLSALLRETVRDHLLSDAPVGFLLSGGVDSTALLSYAREQTSAELSSFTIGFEGENFADERGYARLAAEKYGTKHHEMTISADDFLRFLPGYVSHMEEPVCEPPAIALYYISRLAKDYVKVLISGEGGDEAFAGYQNYRNLAWLERMKSAAGPLSGPLSSLLAGVNRLYGSKSIGKYLPLMNVKLDDYYYSRTSNPFNFFNSRITELYTGQFRESVDKTYSIRPVTDLLGNMNGMDPLNRMLYIDTKTWLPDDLLLKADKITMANSLELRVPFLDHKVLEFAAALPAGYKLSGLKTKHILKNALKEVVPTEILNRKKTGFPVPYESWMKGPLKETITDVILDSKSIERGYFNRKTLEGLLEAGSMAAHPKEVFSLLVLELWHRVFVDGQTVTLA